LAAQGVVAAVLQCSCFPFLDATAAAAAAVLVVAVLESLDQVEEESLD